MSQLKPLLIIPIVLLFTHTSYSNSSVLKPKCANEAVIAVVIHNACSEDCGPGEGTVTRSLGAVALTLKEMIEVYIVGTSDEVGKREWLAIVGRDKCNVLGLNMASDGRGFDNENAIEDIITCTKEPGVELHCE